MNVITGTNLESVDGFVKGLVVIKRVALMLKNAESAEIKINQKFFLQFGWGRLIAGSILLNAIK